MRINKATKSSYGEIARKIIHSVCSVGLTGTQILQEAKDSARFSSVKKVEFIDRHKNCIAL